MTDGISEYVCPKEISDPKVLIDCFYESKNFARGIVDLSVPEPVQGYDEYKKQVAIRREKSGITGDEITEDEMKKTYLATNSARDIFFRYLRDEVMFNYDPKFYPEYVQGKIEHYHNFLVKLKSGRNVLQHLDMPMEYAATDLKEIDDRRQSLHLQVAKSLVEFNLAPNVELAKLMSSAFLVSFGDVTYTSVESDMRNKDNMLKSN